MGERVKKDVKLLLILALVLSLFNVAAVQFFLFDVNKEVNTDKWQTLPSEGSQKDVVVASSSNRRDDNSDKTESEVYKYVNDQLAKYGYDSIETKGTQKNSVNSNSEQENDSPIHLNGNSGQNQQSNQENNQNDANENTNEDDNSDQEDNQQDYAQPDDSTNEEDEEQDEEDDDSGLPAVPPNETGLPAESVEGKDLEFNFDFGFG